MKLHTSFLLLSFTCVTAVACGGSDDDAAPGASPAAGAAGAGGGSSGAAGNKSGAGGAAQAGAGGKAQAGAGGKAQAGAGGAATAGSGGATAGSAGAPGGSGGASAGGAGAPGGSGGASAGSAGAPAGSGGASAGSAGAPGGAGGGSGGGDTPDCSPAAGAVPTLKLTPVITQGIGKPVLVTHAPGDPARLYIVQKTGIVRVAQGGKLTGVFVDLSSKLTSSGNEQGLLGLAFHPQFAQNGRVFVHFSSKASQNPGTQDGDTVIAELHGTPDAGDLATLKTLMTVAQPDANHNGGSVEFSPKDGFLYIALGDGGGGGDKHGPIGNGQKLDTMLAKLLRVDTSTVGQLAVPATNPKIQGANPEIWSYGLRNPYRISFDMCSGDRYIADVGQGEHEEVDVEPAASPGGLNYGWRIMEGMECYNAASCDKTGLTLPVTTYDHSQGNCSVTGGYVYRGAAIPGLRGRYLYGDYCSGRVWSFAYVGGVATAPLEHTTELGTAGMPISGFGQDANGEVYLLSYGGAVYRIDQ